MDYNSKNYNVWVSLPNDYTILVAVGLSLNEIAVEYNTSLEKVAQLVGTGKPFKVDGDKAYKVVVK